MKSRITSFVAGIVLTIVICLGVTHIWAANNDAGSVSDPLVTKSYVDKLVDTLSKQISSGTTGTATQPTNMTEIYKYIDNKFADMETTKGASFVVVEVAAGKKIYGKASTEMILRTGKAKAIGNKTGEGISDVTSGKDIKDGEDITANHLLIIPRDDSRGMLLEKKSYIMVKGGYSVK